MTNKNWDEAINQAVPLTATRGNRLRCSSSLASLCLPLLLLLLLFAIISVVAVRASPAPEGTAPNNTILAGVDFGPFLADMNRRVRRNWSPPRGKENATVVVLFQVGACGYEVSDGEVSNVHLGHTSGFVDADAAALHAIPGRFRLPPGPHWSLKCQFTFDKHTLADGSGAAIVSLGKERGKVKIDNVKTAIEQMRGFSMRFRASGRGDGRRDLEAIKRDEIAKALHAGGAESVQALAQELKSPDLSMRKNASFELVELGDALGAPFKRGTKIDIEAAVPALIKALKDTDSEVRIWSMAA